MSQKWNFWKTGFYFYEYRVWSYPVLYIDRERGYTSAKLSKATKFRTKQAALKHPLASVEQVTLCFQPPVPDYLHIYMT